MNPERENLKFAYSFVLLIKLVACIAAVLTMVTALYVAGTGVYNSIAAEYAYKEEKQAETEALQKRLADVDKKLEGHITEQNEKIDRAKTEYERLFAKASSDYQNAQTQYRQTRDNFNQLINEKLKDLTNHSERAIAELARLTDSDLSKLKKIEISNPGINIAEDASSFSELLLNSVEQTLSSYRSCIFDPINDGYKKLIEPLNSEIEKLHQQIAEIDSKLEDIHQKIKDIEDSHVASEETIYETVTIPGKQFINPDPNIYGLTDVGAMTTINRIRDSLPMLSYGIPVDSPLSKEALNKLRISIVRILQWLPEIQTAQDSTEKKPVVKTVPPPPYTEEEKATLANLSNEAKLLFAEKDKLSSSLDELTGLKENVQTSHNQVHEQLIKVCEGWSVSEAASSLVNVLATYDAYPPDSIDTLLEQLRLNKEQAITEAQNIIAERKTEAEKNQEALKQESALYIKNKSNEERELSSAIMINALIIASSLFACSWITLYLLFVLAEFLACPIVIALRALNKLAND